MLRAKQFALMKLPARGQSARSNVLRPAPGQFLNELEARGRFSGGSTKGYEVGSGSITRHTEFNVSIIEIERR
jgi:hypothetical protein